MASIDDVARLAGVSIATVSRVLNNRGYVSEKTKLKVWKAVRELGYKPQKSARTLASRRLFKVALVISDRIKKLLKNETGNFYAIVLQAIKDVESSFRFSTAPLILESSDPKGFDGFLLIGSDATAEQVMFYRKYGKVVLVDHYIDGLGIDCVVSDGYDGVYKVVQDFVQRGFENIVHLHGPLRFYGFKDRYRGYTEAMQRNGLLPVCYEYDDLHEEITPVLKKIFRDKKVQVLICSNDIIAIRALKELKSWGYRIPEDVSVIGFDDIPQAERIAVNFKGSKV
ncbi:MAG: LacI family DNA-binding transcriptional regulator [Pseudothermotoga sp.]